MFLSHFHFWGRGLTLVNPKLCSPSRAQGEFLDGSGQTAFVSNFRLHGGVGVLVLDAFFKKGDESKRGFFDGAKPRGKRAAAAGGSTTSMAPSGPPGVSFAASE